MKKRFLFGSVAVLACAIPAMANTVEFDQNVNPDVIFGSGNANGAFTTFRSTTNNIELGLRGKLRFNDSNLPENTFNSDGAGNYTFQAGNPPTGFGFDANSPTTPVWNFEWSINTDVDGMGGTVLSDLTYQIRMDGDPTAATNFVAFDPITVPAADHAIGDNTTGNGGGTSATNNVTDPVNVAFYQSLIDNNNVAQNSWNYEFFNDGTFGPALTTFDPTVAGTYTIELEAFDTGGNSLGVSSINIQVVPTPAAALGGFIGLSGLALRRRSMA